MIHALFELAPLAPISLPVKKSLIVGVEETESYKAILKAIQADTQNPEMREYWGIDIDLKQAEEIAINVAESALTVEEEVPFYSVLKPMPQVLVTPYGRVQATQKGGLTIYSAPQVAHVVTYPSAVMMNGMVYYSQ